MSYPIEVTQRCFIQGNSNHYVNIAIHARPTASLKGRGLKMFSLGERQAGGAVNTKNFRFLNFFGF